MIKNIVDGLIELSGTRNPFEICNFLGIQVLIHDLGSQILGFFQKTKDGTEILHINSRLDDIKRKYICSHELGHAILEPDLNISFFIENPLVVKSKHEIKADKFAAELLIHDNLLESYEGFTLEQIAIAENINKELLNLKFNIK
ncbi:hypothetical protein CLPU_6c00080 [Gottschalkia purinilytica]|uniref:IrrE N-terminal-like domain-containing protein n=1 Tax=Gottschalkia purinilytica TaxID=1503 RepID=A0A0L0WAP7_GOTPU|nr:ImmA/IrrE family metallo-endopeptidase [Gottschalkia purinilytica]KNF08522.1 hypothetical protein CLPU_6c00080 [Gottschalkia purinilytica]